MIAGTAPSNLFEDVADKFHGGVIYEPVDSGGRESRQSDSAPFWGGAAVTDGTGTCTTGFTVKRPNGTRYMMTAGHCFGALYGTWSPGNGDWMGQVRVRGVFPNFDMEMIGDENYGQYIYTGGATGTGTSVVSAANPVIGAFYCVSGQKTYEHCGHELISNDSYLCDVSGCTDHLSAYWGDQLNITMNGDSGAPWYIKSSGVYIRGLNIGREGLVMYAHKWSTISSEMNVTIYAP